MQTVKRIVKLNTKIKLDGCICRAGEVVSLPAFRADRMLAANQCEPSTETPRDTERITWVMPVKPYKIKAGKVIHDKPVQVLGERAEKLVKNGKAVLCDAPVKPVAKPKKGKGKKDGSTGAGKED